jgi:hypothetical protein
MHLLGPELLKLFIPVARPCQSSCLVSKQSSSCQPFPCCRIRLVRDFRYLRRRGLRDCCPVYHFDYEYIVTQCFSKFRQSRITL